MRKGIKTHTWYCIKYVPMPTLTYYQRSLKPGLEINPCLLALHIATWSSSMVFNSTAIINFDFTLSAGISRFITKKSLFAFSRFDQTIEEDLASGCKCYFPLRNVSCYKFHPCRLSNPFLLK